MGYGPSHWVDASEQIAPIGPHGDPTSQQFAAPTRDRSVVLNIEDNLSNLKLIRSILRDRADVQLVEATRGSSGLEQARLLVPDLILLDLQLPDITGQSIINILKGDQRTRDIAIVVISADAMPDTIAELLAAGARAYLTKPINVKEFLRLLNQVLGEQRPQQLTDYS